MTKRRAFILTVLLGAACNRPEDIDTALMPSDLDDEAEVETLSAAATVAPAPKPEDDRSMDEILTEEIEVRKARGDAENVTPASGGVGIATVKTTTTNKNCKKGYSTKTCKTPPPLKMSSSEKKKFFDQLAKARKRKRFYDTNGFPFDAAIEPAK